MSVDDFLGASFMEVDDEVSACFAFNSNLNITHFSRPKRRMTVPWSQRTTAKAKITTTRTTVMMHLSRPWTSSMVLHSAECLAFFHLSYSRRRSHTHAGAI